MRQPCMMVICGRWPPPMLWSWVWMSAAWMLHCTLASQVCLPSSPPAPPPPPQHPHPFLTNPYPLQPLVVLPCPCPFYPQPLKLSPCFPYRPLCPSSCPLPLQYRKCHHNSWNVYHLTQEGNGIVSWKEKYYTVFSICHICSTCHS